MAVYLSAWSGYLSPAVFGTMAIGVAFMTLRARNVGPLASLAGTVAALAAWAACMAIFLVVSVGYFWSAGAGAEFAMAAVTAGVVAYVRRAYVRIYHEDSRGVAAPGVRSEVEVPIRRERDRRTPRGGRRVTPVAGRVIGDRRDEKLYLTTWSQDARTPAGARAAFASPQGHRYG